MFSKNNQQEKQRIEARRKQIFSIRKYHFGAASVAVGALMFLGASSAQAAEEVSTESEVKATEATTSSSEETASTEGVTTVELNNVERTAEIKYVVNYVDADGKVVKTTTEVKSKQVKGKELAQDVVIFNAVAPEGYELAQGQDEVVGQAITEGSENVITVKVVTKATEAKEPASEEKGAIKNQKNVLEQNISEAKVLSDEAYRLYTINKDGNEALKNSADKTKSELSKAVELFKNQSATEEEINSQIKELSVKVNELALELKGNDKDANLTVSLAVAADASIGSGTGVLVEAPSTNPGMDDPNGASVASKTQGTMTGTTVANYYTFHYAALSSWYDAVRPGFYPYGFTPGAKPTEAEFKANPLKYGSTDGAYFRASATADPATSPVLVELVSKDGTVLESKYLNVGDSENFTTFQTTSGVDLPIVVTYSGDVQNDSTAGLLSFQFDNNTIQPNFLVPRLVKLPTYYKDKDTGASLASYTMVTQPGLVNTPSNVRDIPGYRFVETTQENQTYPRYAGVSYVDQTRDPYTTLIGSKVIATPVGTDGTVVKELYIRDPDSNLTLDYTSTSPDGFIKLLVTGEMAPGKTNTNTFLHPDLLTKYKVTVSGGPYINEGQIGTGTPITDPADLDLSKNTFDIIVNPNAGYNEFYALRVMLAAANGSRIQTMWIRTGAQGEVYTIPSEPEKIDWTQIITADPSKPDEMAKATPWVDAKGVTQYPILDEHGNLRPRPVNYQGTNQPYSFNNNSTTASDVVLTHWYTPVPQEAIIRYQVEGEAGYREDSGDLTGNPGTDINYSTTDTINKYKKLGYELVSDNFTTDAGPNYDYDSTVKQEFLVVIKPRIEEVPNTAVPGKPVDPTDPNSPVWPTTLENLETTQEVTRKVEYKYEDGTPVLVDATGNVLPKGSTEGTPFVKTEKVTFTRPAQVNLVTGEVTYGDWSADTTDTLKGNVLPQVSGYTASRTTLEGADAPMTETVNAKTVTATDADINEVVYFAENPKYGDVVVNYVNTDGKVIATPVVDTNDALVGTEYSTNDRVPEKIIEDATGDVYYYKEIKPEDVSKETGKVVEGTTEVTYVYEKAGNVIVKYELENGTTLKEPVKDVENGKPGDKNDPADDYTTTDRIEETIKTADGKVYKRVPAKTKGNETGDVESGETIEVTYIYEEVKGNVVVEYYDTKGNPISGAETENKTSVLDTENGSVGTDYDTADKKPEKITTADGKVYYYKEVKSDSATPVGKVAETTTTVKYVYEPGGSVTISYVSKDGKEIKPPVKDEENEKPGKIYSTEDNKPKTIQTADGKTYRLVPEETTGEENGTVTSGEDKKVTYVYEEVKGNVVVKYVDGNGNPISGTADKGVAGKEKEVASEVEDTPLTSTTNTGNGYDTTDNRPETITTADGKVYKLVPAATQGNETGDIVEGTTTVTYVYVEVEKAKGSVVVRYVEAGNESNVLKDPVIDENGVVVGTKYDTTDEGDKPAEIVKDGVRYVLVPSKTTAVDPNGNPVTETGEVAEGTTVVTYKYQKVANWIPQIPATPENPTPVNPVIPYPFDPENPDKPIDPTTPYPGGKVPSIPHVPGYTPVDPKTKEPLKPIDPTDPSKGYVPPTPDETGTDTPIPYVQTGNVVVKYVTEDGTVIKDPVNDETNVPAGKTYDTTDNKPKTITTADGTTYELVRVEGSESGEVVGGKTTVVTYVYKKVTESTSVVTKHVDEDGNPVAPQEEGKKPKKSIPGYEFVKTTVDENGNVTHVYKKVPSTPTTPTNPPIPGDKPGTETPTPTGDKPELPKTETSKEGKLSNTGATTSTTTAAGLGLLAFAAALLARRRKNDK